jgi:hypothetical protein
VLFAARKENSLTDTTLTRVFRHRVDAVEAGTVRLVVRWDRETGWAHLGTAEPDADRTRFAGFHRFAGGSADVVAAELTAAGCVTGCAQRLDDGLMEIEAVLGRREVTAGAAR